MDSEKKVLEFDEIASNVFGSIYQVIASQIKERTNVNQGTCLDIGSCGGHLGVEMAKISDLFVYLFNISTYALNVADERITGNGFNNRMKTLHGDVHSIPLEDETINIAISRGSVWFWEDKVKAFKEIYRVLSPGGFAYIGGGFGNSELKEKVYAKMSEREKNWGEKRKNFMRDNSAEKFTRLLNEANIPSFEIIDDDSGVWIFFKK